MPRRNGRRPGRRLIAVSALAALAFPLSPAFAQTPPNDDFASALALGPPTSVATVDTSGAGLESGEPSPSCADANFGKTVWFTFTPSSRTAVVVDTLVSDYDTIVAIYSGSALNALSEVACNDFIIDAPSGHSLGSRAVAILLGGVTYHIQVGGFNGSSGTLNLQLAKRKSRPGVVRGNTWFLSKDFNGTSEFSFAYGSPSDDPITGDWAGLGGISNPGVRRGNVWLPNLWVDPNSDTSVAFGRATDFPVVGDWDGDSRTTIGVVRGNMWYLNDGFPTPIMVPPFPYGRATDFPIVGDWNADGVTTPGLVRGNQWFLSNGFDGVADASFTYGLPSDYPIVGDWDGNGTVTPGVIRGNFWLLTNGQGPNADIVFTFGSSTDFPIAGDWGPVVGS